MNDDLIGGSMVNGEPKTPLTKEKVAAEQPRKHSRWRNARTGKLVTVIDLWEFVGLGRHVSVRYEESERRRTYSTERFRSEFTEVGPHD